MLHHKSPSALLMMEDLRLFSTSLPLRVSIRESDCRSHFVFPALLNRSVKMIEMQSSNSTPSKMNGGGGRNSTLTDEPVLYLNMLDVSGAQIRIMMMILILLDVLSFLSHSVLPSPCFHTSNYPRIVISITHNRGNGF